MPGRLMSAPGTATVLKVGGSLCRNPRAARELMGTLESMAGERTLVVVPGGGRFADEVRRADQRFALDASPSHWMAILAMDQSAYLLAHLARRAVLVRRPGEIRGGRLNILAPFAWLRDTDPLPHSWDVTSDSIAAWVARTLRAHQLVLLKSTDGVPDSAPTVRASTMPIRRRVTRGALGDIVDGHFAPVLPRGISCWIVNGRRPERVAALLETGSTYGTEITMRRERSAQQRGRGARRRARARARG